jgi:hypothetical protein
MRAPGGDHLGEAAEEVPRVVGPRRRLGVVLHAEERQLAVGQALHGPVVQAAVRDFDRVRQPLVGHRVAVVLRGDGDLAGPLVAHGVVDPAVPELELERHPSQRVRGELVPEADPEDRHLAEQGADRLDLEPADRRVARPVGEEDPVGAQRQRFRGRGVGRHDGQSEAGVRQQPEHVPLGPVVEGDDVRAVRRRLGGGTEQSRPPFAPGMRALAGHPPDQVEFADRGRGPGAGDRLLGPGPVGGEQAAHDPGGAQVARQGAGVDSADADDAGRHEILCEVAVGAPG